MRFEVLIVLFPSKCLYYRLWVNKGKSIHGGCDLLVADARAMCTSHYRSDYVQRQVRWQDLQGHLFLRQSLNKLCIGNATSYHHLFAFLIDIYGLKFLKADLRTISVSYIVKAVCAAERTRPSRCIPFMNNSYDILVV